MLQSVHTNPNPPAKQHQPQQKQSTMTSKMKTNRMSPMASAAISPVEMWKRFKCSIVHSWLIWQSNKELIPCNLHQIERF